MTYRVKLTLCYLIAKQEVLLLVMNKNNVEIMIKNYQVNHQFCSILLNFRYIFTLIAGILLSFHSDAQNGLIGAGFAPRWSNPTQIHT